MGSLALRVADRFAKFVPNWGDESSDECWLWTGHTVGHMAYGHMAYQGSKALAHRVSYVEFVGPIEEGSVVMHTCDTPRCVRPSHLRIGTVADNQADMARKGRGRVPGSLARQANRAAALGKPCPKCGGPRVLQGVTSQRVRCPRRACRGGQ